MSEFYFILILVFGSVHANSKAKPLVSSLAVDTQNMTACRQPDVLNCQVFTVKLNKVKLFQVGFSRHLNLIWNY